MELPLSTFDESSCSGGRGRKLYRAEDLPNAPATALVMEKIVEEVFVTEHVTIYHGNREVNQALLSERFDYIFFTGSPSLGKSSDEAAANNLTPVTLELGGKSPCIVDEDATLPLRQDALSGAKQLMQDKPASLPII
jgi:aldehyde dehydrogenase (NAD+)